MPRHRTSKSYWQEPLKWNKEAARTGKRHLVFCASLADVFDNEWQEGIRYDLWALIRATPALTWQLVTKRIGNVIAMLPADWRDGYANVWIISTIVNQDEADRDMDKLLSVPAHVHGVSYEPALGPVNWLPWLDRSLDWIIIGGESTQANHVTREFNLQWARNTIDQCRVSRRRVYPFMKQVGSRPTPHMKLLDRAGAEPKEWPADLQVREFPPQTRLSR